MDRAPKGRNGTGGLVEADLSPKGFMNLQQAYARIQQLEAIIAAQVAVIDRAELLARAAEGEGWIQVKDAVQEFRRAQRASALLRSRI